MTNAEAELARLKAGTEDGGVRELVEAAYSVCWFDWSDSDEDAVKAIDQLNNALKLIRRST